MFTSCVPGWNNLWYMVWQGGMADTKLARGTQPTFLRASIRHTTPKQNKEPDINLVWWRSVLHHIYIWSSTPFLQQEQPWRNTRVNSMSRHGQSKTHSTHSIHTNPGTHTRKRKHQRKRKNKKRCKVKKKIRQLILLSYTTTNRYIINRYLKVRTTTTATKKKKKAWARCGKPLSPNRDSHHLNEPGTI